MRATLEEMKANLAKIKRSGLLRQHDQLDVDLWEAMVQHMESMEKMMAQMSDMPIGQAHSGRCTEDVATDALGTKGIEAADAAGTSAQNNDRRLP